MQLVESKLYLANVPGLQIARTTSSATPADGFFSRLKTTSASARLLALMLTALVVTASPVLLGTIRSAITLAFQILLQAGHFGLIAFQIFGR